jgi:DNA replication protein DnaC
MIESVIEKIQECTDALKLTSYAGRLPMFLETESMSPDQLDAVYKVLSHLSEQKNEAIVQTLLKMSRLPLKEPKTFENFDYSRLHGRQIDALKELPNLSALYARKNLAFIGPPGVGKTHLGMAFGRLCCENGLKTYFLKATELNQRLHDARKYGRESSVINGLVKPSCLIIDEVGRSVFDKENTRMFFDVIDRRYNKDVPNTLILTSNKSPDKWGEFFSEDSSLLCALDRIFDTATVFMIKGNTYRGRKCETVALSTGDALAVTKS